MLLIQRCFFARLCQTTVVDGLRIPSLGRNIGNTWLPIALSHPGMPFVESIHRVSPDKCCLQELFSRGFIVMETNKESFRYGKIEARLHCDLFRRRV